MPCRTMRPDLGFGMAAALVWLAAAVFIWLAAAATGWAAAAFGWAVAASGWAAAASGWAAAASGWAAVACAWGAAVFVIFPTSGSRRPSFPSVGSTTASAFIASATRAAIARSMSA